MFIKHKAQLDAPDFEGKTPIEYSLKDEDEILIGILMDHHHQYEDSLLSELVKVGDNKTIQRILTGYV